METVEFNVPAVSCSICAGKIKDGLGTLSGIENVSVDLKTQNVQVQYRSGEVQPQEISRKIVSMGYEITR